MGKMNSLAQQLGMFAQQALLYEAVLSPKPGLVDATNVGAHHDMTIFTFLDSSTALYPGLIAYAKQGLQHKGTPIELFQSIRPLGITMEKNMNQATHHVNTHKGAIFSFGILLAASGFYLQEKKIDLTAPLSSEETEAIFKIGQNMVKDTLAKDFIGLEQKEHLSNGERLYLEFGLTGIRGEALNGYPLIRTIALPYLRKEVDGKLTLENKLLTVLLLLISKSEDSNLINRGGIEGLAWAKSTITDYLKKYSPEATRGKEQLHILNQAFVHRNLSPGGSADLLALTIFIAKLEHLLD